MRLLVDAGNTNIVFALHDAGKFCGMWRCATDTKRTSDEYAVWLSQLLALQDISFKQISQAVIGSVVPGVNFNLQRLCEDHFKLTPHFVTHQSPLGIGLKLDRPAEIGADRVLNAVAALQQVTPPLIVVDFGTATTFDVVDDEGAYCGGVIAPGINLSLEALQRAAAKLPKIDIAAPATVIGRNTIDAMQSGIFWGYLGLVEHLVQRIEKEYGKTMQVIATGGLAPLFAPYSSRLHRYDGDLTLKGLLLIAERLT